MKFQKIICIKLLSIFLIINTLYAQEEKKQKSNSDNNNIFSGLNFRSIGPALMSGRISDIVIHPENENIWYVTAGSGGVWKTENSGTTWSSIFDNQKSYSIGCISVNKNNPIYVQGSFEMDYGGDSH